MFKFLASLLKTALKKTAVLTTFVVRIHNMQCYHLIMGASNIYGNQKANRRRSSYKFDFKYRHTVWVECLCTTDVTNWVIGHLWRSPVAQSSFLIYCMSLVPGYREIVLQSLPQISALDDLDRLGNPSHQGLVSPCDVPGLDDFVDLLLSSDTSHSEVVLFIYCFYPIILSDSDILITINELLGNYIFKISHHFCFILICSSHYVTEKWLFLTVACQHCQFRIYSLLISFSFVFNLQYFYNRKCIFVQQWQQTHVATAVTPIVGNKKGNLSFICRSKGMAVSKIPTSTTCWPIFISQMPLKQLIMQSNNKSTRASSPFVPVLPIPQSLLMKNE